MSKPPRLASLLFPASLALLTATSLIAYSAARPGAPGTMPAAAPATRPQRPPIALSEPADKPAARTAGSWMRHHNQNVANAKKGGIDLYMLGDSITDFWGNASTDSRRVGDRENWDKNLAPWKAGDFGISGDLTQQVLWRITNGELDGVHPKAIVLMIGTNNLPQSSGYTPQQVSQAIKDILDILKDKQPQAKILLMGIFPRQDFTRTKGISIQDKVDQTNELISHFADGKQVTYLDIKDKFLDKDGKILQGVMFDQLHPTPRGYQIWADAITPILTEWLGPRPATAPAGQVP